tara:strand:- start:247 stop:420 length:174 start_codon:yes stop_codon:yes gene_type:complete
MDPFNITRVTPNMPSPVSKNKYYKNTSKFLKNININSKKGFKNAKNKDMGHFQRKNK